MSRWIDADDVLELLNLMYDNQEDKDDPYNVGVMGAINYIKHKAPSIDIVRCGDCKWFNEEYGSCHAYHWDLNQGLEYAEVDADDFCSYGEQFGKTEQLVGNSDRFRKE